MHDQLLLLATILAQWQQLMASVEALNNFYWAMHAESYRQNATAIKMARKLNPFFHGGFVCCCPGGHQGNTERVVA